MKYFVRHLSVGLLVIALAGITVLGKTKSATVNFYDDVTVGGTTVKAGEYKVQFDDKTGELTIRKGGKVVAKTTATLQDRGEKARSTTMQFRDNQLVSIAFGGEHQQVVVGQTNPTTGTEQ
jgi:hypothetical protein